MDRIIEQVLLMSEENIETLSVFLDNLTSTHK